MQKKKKKKTNIPDNKAPLLLHLSHLRRERENFTRIHSRDSPAGREADVAEICE